MDDLEPLASCANSVGGSSEDEARSGKLIGEDLVDQLLVNSHPVVEEDDS